MKNKIKKITEKKTHEGGVEPVSSLRKQAPVFHCTKGLDLYLLVQQLIIYSKIIEPTTRPENCAILLQSTVICLTMNSNRTLISFIILDNVLGHVLPLGHYNFKEYVLDCFLKYFFI